MERTTLQVEGIGVFEECRILCGKRFDEAGQERDTDRSEGFFTIANGPRAYVCSRLVPKLRSNKELEHET